MICCDTPIYTLGAITNSLLADSFSIDSAGAEISGSDLSQLSWRLARTTRHFASSHSMAKQVSGNLSQLVLSVPGTRLGSTLYLF